MRRLRRADVPVDDTWKLEDLFPTADDWQNQLNAALGDIPSVSAFSGRLAEGAVTLLECLEATERLMMRMLRVARTPFFASLKTDPIRQTRR